MITISSANYPSNYGNNIECAWFFTSPGGTNIVFTVLAFVTENSYDFVRIGSGTNPSMNEMQALTGTIAASTSYTVTSTQAWMRFSTDVTQTASGFQIRVSYT